MKLFWLLGLVHFGNGICPRSAETAPQFEEFLNLTQGENLYDGKSELTDPLYTSFGPFCALFRRENFLIEILKIIFFHKKYLTLKCILNF